MKIIFRILILALFSISNIDYSHGQTYSTTSKSCGNCGRSVSANSKKGDRCPHCGVIWGSENSHVSTSNYSIPNYPSSSNYSKSPNPVSSKSTVQKQEKNEEVVVNSTATKSETEIWILDKLKTNTPQRYLDYVEPFNSYLSILPTSSRYKMNYTYSFDAYNLIIRYEEDYNNKITRYKISIPIYDIDRVYDYEGDFWITTKKETIVVYDIANNTKRVTGIFKTDFNVYSETDLCERLNTAFLHLKKFYKKPISTEPF